MRPSAFFNVMASAYMALVAFVLLERGFAQDVAPKGTDVPGQPAPPVFVASNSTSLSVSWAMPEVDGGSPVLWYTLYGGDAAESLRPLYDPFRAGAAPEPNVRNFTIRRLRPSTRYRFMIAARNAVGQSKFSDTATFSTTAPVPTVSHVVPAAGPLRGGTLVRVHGADLVFGGTSVHACRFGQTVVPATLTEGAWPEHVPTRPIRMPRDEGDGRAVVECISPRARQARAIDLGPGATTGQPLRLSTQLVELQVALDGRQFGAVIGTTFVYYEPPAPVIVSPASGPLAGGTVVSIRGLFPRADNGFFGPSSASLHSLPASFDFPKAACNFSGAIVPATLVPLHQTYSNAHPRPRTLGAPPPTSA